MEAGQNLASPAETPKPQNFFSRLMGVLFSPGETFAEIGRAPSVFLPLVCAALLAAVTVFAINNRYGWDNTIRKQNEIAIEMMEKFNAPPDRVEAAKKQMEDQLKPENISRLKVRTTGSVFFFFIVILLVVAGVFKLFTSVMGASNTFKGVLSAVSFAYLAIGVITCLVTVLSVYLKNPEDINLQNPVASNLGAILTMVGAGLPKFLIGLAGFIDIFSIWRITLLAIGCAAVTTKMKTGTAAIPHVLLYVVAAVFGAFAASFMN